MSEVAEVIQSLFDNRLDMLLPERDPAFVGQYQISNRMVNSLAHLVGTTGTYSRLLKCNANGALEIFGADVETKLDTLHADIIGKQPVKIVDTAGVNQLKVDADNSLHAGVWWQTTQAKVCSQMDVIGSDLGLVVSNYFTQQVSTILSDVHDPVNHYLKVHETV